MKETSSTAYIADETDNTDSSGMGDNGVAAAQGSSLSVNVRKTSTYDLPLIMPLVRRHGSYRFVPFCPTFAGCAWVHQRLCRSRNEQSSTYAAADVDDNAMEEPVELQ